MCVYLYVTEHTNILVMLLVGGPLKVNVYSNNAALIELSDLMIGVFASLMVYLFYVFLSRLTLIAYVNIMLIRFAGGPMGLDGSLSNSFIQLLVYITSGVHLFYL